MTESSRKPLGLPDKVVEVNPKRRPVRGGAPNSRRKPDTTPEPQIEEAPKKKDWRQHDARKVSAPSQTRSTGAEKRPRQDTRPARSASAPKPELASGVRVSKLLAERGVCSRREADAYIERGWVLVNGVRVTELGTRAAVTDEITLDRAAQASQRGLVTIILHKPVGYVSGQPEPGCIPAVKLILPENQHVSGITQRFQPGHLRGLAPAGRLDIDSTGLLVLTQDGRVARRLIGEDSEVEKEYLVRVEGTLAPDGLALLRHGLSLDGRKLKPAEVEWLNDDQLRFVLKEGRKRQIRRMCELVGLRVVGLKRVRTGRVMLGDLPQGKWRYLREGETF